MRRGHLLEYPSGELTLFYAAREADHDEFWMLISLIKAEPHPPWQLIEAALSMLPTHDRLPWHFDMLQDLPHLQRQLFGDAKNEGAIVELHSFTPPSPPKPAKEWKPGEEFTAEHLGFPHSGDQRCDAIASLLASTEFNVEGVIALTRWLSREELSRALYSAQELMKGSEQRVKEMIEKTAATVREGGAADAAGNPIDIAEIVSQDLSVFQPPG